MLVVANAFVIVFTDSNNNNNNNNNTLTSGEFKKQIEQELKQNWIEKKMYEQFIREMPENVDKNKTWQWLSKCDLKIRQKHCYVQHRNRPVGQTM